MFRTFKITLPADTNNHNLFSLIVGNTGLNAYSTVHGGTSETGITGAVPTDGTMYDRVSSLEIQADSGNGNTLIVNDRNNANTTGKVLNAGDTFSRASGRNSICLKDFFLAGGAASQAMEVGIEII